MILKAYIRYYSVHLKCVKLIYLQHNTRYKTPCRLVLQVVLAEASQILCLEVKRWFSEEQTHLPWPSSNIAEVIFKAFHRG